MPRARLVDLLWEGTPEREARRTLTNTLVRLKAWLPAAVLAVDGDAVRWDPAAGVGLDLADARAASGASDPATLASAAELWRGELLAGVPAPAAGGELEQWLRVERRAWQARYVDVLAKLVEAELGAGRLAEAERWALRGLAEDAASELFHRARILARHEAGDRAGGLAAFEAYATAVAELGLRPARGLVALRDALVAGRSSAPPPRRRVEPMRQAAPDGVRLVGRDDLLGRLVAALDAARAGGPPVVVLRGAAGVGKSRLVRAALEATRPGQAAGFGCQVVAACHDSTADLSFAPLVEALGGAIAELGAAALRCDDVWLAELSRLLPELQARRPDLVPRASPDADVRRQRLFQSLGMFLAGLPKPTLLAIEDVHWLDEASRAVLATLAHDPRLTGTAVLLTVREGETTPEVERLLGELHRAGRSARLDVAPLDATGTGELVGELLGRRDEEIAASVFGETGGNPLYVVHLVRGLAANVEAPAGRMGAAPVPEAVGEIVRERLAHLPSSAHRLANAVAVCPRGAPFDFARAVAELGEDDALDALDGLVAAGVVEEDAAGTLRFSHDLVGRAVGAAMTAARRRALNVRAFHLLVEATGSDARDEGWAARLAHHAAEGALWADAVHWCRIAAEAAESLGAGREAAEYLTRGLGYLERLPPGEQATRHAVELRLRLAGNVPALTPPEGEQTLREAEQAARTLADDRLELDVALTRVTQLATRGRLREGMPVAEELLGRARATGDDRLIASALRALGTLASLRGELARSIELLDESVVLARRIGEFEILMSSLGTLTVVHSTRGELELAEARLSEIAAVTESVGGPLAKSFLCSTTTRIRAAQGCWDEAVATAREGLAHARDAGHELVALLSGFALGFGLYGRGDFAAAEQAFTEAIEADARTGFQSLLDRLWAQLAATRARRGDVDGARLALERGRALALEESAPYGLAMCARAEALILKQTGDDAAAAAASREAVAGFEAIGARCELARTLAVLAEVTPDPAEAAEATDRATRIAAEIGLVDLVAGPPTAAGTAPVGG